jgi:DNA polymerase III delta subunit
LPDVLRQKEPVMVLAVLTRQILQLYAARLLIENRKPQQELMKICGMKSPYQAKAVYTSAGRRGLKWYRFALGCCYEADEALRQQGLANEMAMDYLLGRLFTGV